MEPNVYKYLKSRNSKKPNLFSSFPYIREVNDLMITNSVWPRTDVFNANRFSGFLCLYLCGLARVLGQQ